MSFKLEPLLCQEEKERAKKFKLAHPRTQFIATRGALRLLLGHYLPPLSSPLVFSQTAHGKPILPPPFENVHFNISHSGHSALIAITQTAAVGVDIEVHQPLKDLTGLLEMVGHPRELAAWQALPSEERTNGFYQLWTLKEALSKAVGLGLGLDFRKLEIGMQHGKQAGLIQIDGSLDKQAIWQIQALAPQPGYSAALATSPATQIRQFELKMGNDQGLMAK